MPIDRSSFQDNVAQGGSSDFGGGNARAPASNSGSWPGIRRQTSPTRISAAIWPEMDSAASALPAGAAGSAIASLSGSLSLSNVKVVDNEAFGGDGPPGSVANGANGGGIFNYCGSTMTLTDCSISGNVALGGTRRQRRVWRQSGRQWP